jgi:ammonium transporter Rh
MWPSFNAAIATPGVEQSRAIVNTFLSLTGSTVASFVISRHTSEGRFNVVHIQNSVLSGGVAMGIAAHLELQLVTALSVGFLTGTVSVLGYAYLTPLMNRYLRVQDVCGVHNLHGMRTLVVCVCVCVVCRVSWILLVVFFCEFVRYPSVCE